MSGQIEPDVCSTELAESLSRLAMPAARDDVGLSNGKILTAGGGVCWRAFFRALEIRGLICCQGALSLSPPSSQHSSSLRQAITMCRLRNSPNHSDTTSIYVSAPLCSQLQSSMRLYFIFERRALVEVCDLSRWQQPRTISEYI